MNIAPLVGRATFADCYMCSQVTLDGTIRMSGIGVHNGQDVNLNIEPAPAGCGIVFYRTDIDDSDTKISVAPSSVRSAQLCTVIGTNDAATVSTVEHLLAALSGCGVDNARIEINGPEVPILDGSALEYVEAIEKVGVVSLECKRRVIRVLKPVEITNGLARCGFMPYDGFKLDIEIEFANEMIGVQQFDFEGNAETFKRELSPARTFGFMEHAEVLRAQGFALGASLENTVVISGQEILNVEGLRFPDEFVRHKTLDAIGDLAIAGAPILGMYYSYRGGHQANFTALSALLQDDSAWEIIEMS